MTRQMPTSQRLMLRRHQAFLNKEKARANRELVAIESFLEQLSVTIQHEVDEELKESLQQLLEEMKKQKASNEILRKTIEEALLMTKIAEDEIQLDVKDTTEDNSSKAVPGLIDTCGEFRNVRVNISGTTATNGSFVAAGILQNVDLSMPGFKK